MRKAMHPELGIQPDDRRSEPRLPASGEVTLNVDDPMEIQVTGELLDISKHGFRARHACQSLHSGQVVRFRHSRATGQARVVWNRIESEQVESGFFIV